MTKLFITVALAATTSVVFANLNIADPAKHPYVDPAGGRENHRHTSEETNSVRVYEFYQRQADYYMALPEEERPAILPAFPGLDAGQHGHWGKYNKNEHKDGRWNKMDIGTVVSIPLAAGKLKVEKAVNVQLGKKLLHACFDPATLTYPVVWQADSDKGNEGFLGFGEWRWGLPGNSTQTGRSYLRLDGLSKLVPPNPPIYRGYHRSGARVAFEYDLAEKPVLDSPDALPVEDTFAIFTRTLTFPEGVAAAKLPLFEIPKGAKVDSEDATILTKGEESFIIDGVDFVAENGLVSAKFEPLSGAQTIRIAIWRGPTTSLSAAKSVLAAVKATPVDISKPSPHLQWPKTVTLAGERSTNPEGRAYTIDTLPVPLKNPYRSTMMLSGFGFFSNGDAAVSTLMGDIWRVSGIDDALEAVTWKRYAAGISIPFGIEIIGDQVIVAGKQQITRLHDTDDNGEADFYENWSSDYLDDHGHPHIYGLGMDEEENAYFIREFDIAKIDGKTRKYSAIAGGVRNCMGFGTGMLDGKFTILAAPQEGDWTPASMIIRPKEGAFYGFDPKANKLPRVDIPLCYIPRAVDNSTGGFVFMDSDRWGPLGKSLIGLSYGYGSHYLVLYDGSGPHGQAATVTLPGNFRAGPVRGGISPIDGQLYTAGTDGWGNYALQDGSLERVRYTGKKIHTPIGFQVFKNGIQINFTTELDPAAIIPKNFFAHQWNYEYAKRYGSPEFSVREPKKLGHDIVKISSAKLLEDKKSIFLEIPDLEPVMQMHIRMHLATTEGESYRTDLFPTIIEMGANFGDMAHAKHLYMGHSMNPVLKPRIRGQKKSKQLIPDEGPPNESWAAAKKIEIKTIEGLQYETKEITAKPGEKIIFTLRNVDVMPHNWVLCKPGTKAVVGEAAFKMLNDPEALEKSYVPTEVADQIIAHTHVVSPKTFHTIYFQAPQEPGIYPYICTFPGHWQIMQGTLTIK